MTAANLRDFTNTSTDGGISRYGATRTTQHQVTLTRDHELTTAQRVPPEGPRLYGILFQHPHAPIHTYPPAASKLTRHHQRKKAAISSRSTTVMTATSPKVASWQCCAAPQRELGVLGLWGNAPNRSSRTEGPERLASLEQTQPYHEVCGMGAWRAWSALES